jgi:hypothetical protein
MILYVCKNPCCRRAFDGAGKEKCPVCGTPKDEAWSRPSLILNHVKARNQQATSSVR